jgi:acyl-CoA synthetase (NDP forming)
VIGASSRPGALSGRFISELARHGYIGQISPVNPRYSEVLGRRCFSTVTAAADEGPIDLVVIALSEDRVLDALEESYAAGAGGAMIFTSGFSETGAEGREREEQLRHFAERTGFRVLGPNCAGFINVRDSVCLMMSSIAFREEFVSGGVSLVSQSGGVTGVVLERAQDAGVGLGLALSTGNEADITLGETLRWMAGDESVEVVAGYVEGIRDAGQFIGGLEALRDAGKPVVIMKVGATEAGARATEAHTGSLATPDDVIEAVFQRLGVIRVFGFDDLIDTAVCLQHGRTGAGRRVGILTTSGGVGTVAAEAAERAGLEVPSLSERTRALLSAAMPDFASLQNPVDMTAMFQEDLSIFDACLRAFSEAEEIDTLVLSIATHAPAFAERLADQFIDYVSGGGTKPVILWPAGAMSALAQRRLRQSGFAVVEDVERCMRAIAAAGALLPDSRLALAPVVDARVPVEAPSEIEVLAAFAAAGVPTIESIACRDEQQAVRAAQQLGARVVVKAYAPGLLHKTDIGAVVVGVEGPQACAEAHRHVVHAAARAGFEPEGSIIQPLAPDGIELVVGVRRDPNFGSIIVVAPGGTGVELTTDVVRRLLPPRVGEAEEMLRELRSYPLLSGYRGRPPADLDAAARAVEALAGFAVSFGDRLEAAEINPLIVHTDGAGASAVDAVLVLTDG